MVRLNIVCDLIVAPATLPLLAGPTKAISWSQVDRHEKQAAHLNALTRQTMEHDTLFDSYRAVPYHSCELPVRGGYFGNSDLNSIDIIDTPARV